MLTGDNVWVSLHDHTSPAFVVQLVCECGLVDLHASVGCEMGVCSSAVGCGCFIGTFIVAIYCVFASKTADKGTCLAMVADDKFFDSSGISSACKSNSA